MKLHKPFSVQFIHLPALMLVTAWVVSGCSGSDEPIGSNPVVNDPVVGEPVVGEPVVDDPVVGEPVVDDPVVGEPVVDDPVVGDPVVGDPLIQNRMLVTFEMTVPFYLSNTLRVELVWGDMNLTAMWVGGQFWSASGEFPTETEHPLTIIFYDNNGAVELAKFSQEYRTGSNATESVQILAEQFDASQFDSDGDGVNNLSELTAGTDPFVDEDSLLEIEDFYALSDHRSRFSRMSVSESFESLLSKDRPSFGTFEYHPDWTEPVSGNINIDADGNGTLDVNSDEVPRRHLLILTGTRTHSGSSISWTGVRREWDSDYGHIENVTNTVSIVDENVRSFVEEVTGSNNGTFEFSWETSTNLTGNLIEGTSLCKPVAGTFTTTHRTRDPDTSVVVTTVSKEIDDPYWRVVVVDDDANNLNDNESETREYFVRDLRILQRTTAPESAFFICDFVDL